MKKPEVITIKHIAKALNLSISTVSKALRSSYEISIATQTLVKKYAEEHNYRANPIAQGLRKGRSKSIAVILPNIDNYFFSQVVNGVESVAFNKGYNVIITQTHESYEREVNTTHHHFARSVDGLIVSLSSETNDTSHFAEVQKNGLPIVFFDRVPDNIAAHKVISNNFKGTYEATLHLIKQGYKRIAHITSAGILSITVERLAGYVQALEENNIPVNEALIKYCAHGGMIKDEAHIAVYELLTMKDKPDAILMASDRLSILSISILKKLDVKIPEDIAVIGFSNAPISEILSPPFTTIVQPAFEIGQQVTEMLIKQIESKYPVTTFEKIILDTKLEIRDSSINKRKQTSIQLIPLS